MCIIGNFHNILYRNIFGEKRIDPKNKLNFIFEYIKIKMGKKLFGVYASICPSRRCNLYFRPQQNRKGFFQNLLHANLVRLALPSKISFSIIGYFEKIPQSFLFQN